MANQASKRLPWTSNNSQEHKTGVLKVDISSCGARAEKLSVHFLVQNSCSYPRSTKRDQVKSNSATRALGRPVVVLKVVLSFR